MNISATSVSFTLTSVRVGAGSAAGSTVRSEPATGTTSSPSTTPATTTGTTTTGTTGSGTKPAGSAGSPGCVCENRDGDRFERSGESERGERGRRGKRELSPEARARIAEKFAARAERWQARADEVRENRPKLAERFEAKAAKWRARAEKFGYEYPKPEPAPGPEPSPQPGPVPTPTPTSSTGVKPAGDGATLSVREPTANIDGVATGGATPTSAGGPKVTPTRSGVLVDSVA